MISGFYTKFLFSEVPRKGFVLEHESKIHTCFGLQFLEISLVVTETRSVPPFHFRASCFLGLLFLNSRFLGQPWSWLLSLSVPTPHSALPQKWTSCCYLLHRQVWNLPQTLGLFWLIRLTIINYIVIMGDNGLLCYSISTIDSMHQKPLYCSCPLALQFHKCQQSFIYKDILFTE